MARTADSDEELVARIAAGDDGAMALLYRRHVDAVVAFLRRRVPEPEVAFDLAAETFAAVIGAAPSYAAEGPVIAWLLGIARNKLLESLRRSRVEDAARRRLGLDPVVLTEDDLRRVEERAAAGVAGLDRALAELPEPIRAALVARVVDEREYAAIAADLRCSEQVVRQRVSRGLSRLRAALGEAR